MKFSIITAVYNNKASLKKAIESLRTQSYKDFEHIIVDGASTDGTVEILRHFDKLSEGLAQDDNEKQGDDYKNKLKWISEPDKGIYDAINKGINMASGDMIGLLHSDDTFTSPEVLSKIADKFSDDNIDSVYSDLVYVRDAGKEQSVEGIGQDSEKTDHSSLITDYYVLRYWKSGDPSSLITRTKWIKQGWMPPHPTLFVRKAVFEKYELYDTNFKIASDYEMILRLFYKYKISSSYLPVTIYAMKTGGTSNKSLGNIFTKSKEDYLAMKMNDIPFPLFTLLCKNFRKLPQFLVKSK